MAGSRRPLTHTLTHTGKRADGDNGHKSSGKDGTPERRGCKRVWKQQTLSSQSVGKDEVGGSNPPNTSRKRSLFIRKVVFFFAFYNCFYRLEFRLLPLTTEQATDRKKTGLRGQSALGGPFVQLAGFCCFARSFPAAIPAFISRISSASFSSHSASVLA